MKRPLLIRFLLLSVVTACAAVAQDKDGDQVTSAVSWNGFKKTVFELNGARCFVIAPAEASAGKPWIWRTSFPGYHDVIDVELVRRGFHLAYIDVVKMLGSDAALDLMDAFYGRLRSEYGLAEKPALEAVSRGGLNAYRYAARHPKRIACIYADVPVMDLKSWPLKANVAEQVQDAIQFYGFNGEEDLKAYKGNPVDLLEPIAKAKIPLRHVITLEDRIVPPEENTLEAKKRLNKLGWDIDVVIAKEGVKNKGHHFDPVPEVEETVEFILQHAATTDANPGR
jgi:pimeloyl-ACP methyl ester carboxylesterase